MRLLAWNLNHRAARRRIPAWVAAAISIQSPDALVLTEYVEGPDHERFLGDLREHGYPYTALSTQLRRHNQVLVAAREPLRRGSIMAPPIHNAVPPNALHVVLEGSGLEVLGFRMPAFPRADRLRKRETWEWLLREATELRLRPAVIAGDFNTAPSDREVDCGDCLERLVRSGWHHAQPPSGHSWRHLRTGAVRQIDHIFLSPALGPGHARYDWAFQALAQGTRWGTVGFPDHAMVVADIKLGSA